MSLPRIVLVLFWLTAQKVPPTRGQPHPHATQHHPPRSPLEGTAMKSALSSDSECGPIFALFFFWGKVQKKPVEASSATSRERERMKLLNPVHDENLEDLHDAELECQRDLL